MKREMALAVAVGLLGGCNESSSPSDASSQSDTETGSSGGAESTGEVESSATGGGSDATSTSTSSASVTSTGSDSDASSSGSDQAVCVDYGESCSQCELEQCEEIYCDCYGNPDCGLGVLCVLECAPGDDDCANACLAMYSDGASDAVLLADCAAVSCSDACGAFEVPPALTDCQRCVYTECAPEMDACFAVEGCPELLVCVDECGADTACQTACTGLYPAAFNAAVVSGNCSIEHCEAACAD